MKLELCSVLAPRRSTQSYTVIVHRSKSRCHCYCGLEKTTPCQKAIHGTLEQEKRASTKLAQYEADQAVRQNCVEQIEVSNKRTLDTLSRDLRSSSKLKYPYIVYL
jgi:hypothetical protein